MANQAGIELWTSARQDVTAELVSNGNTITITPVTLSADTDEWGEYTRTLGTPFDTSAVTYDTNTLRRDYGESMILNDGESLMLIQYDVSVGDNDIVLINNIEYTVQSIEPLEAADILLAQILRVGLKQD